MVLSSVVDVGTWDGQMGGQTGSGEKKKEERWCFLDDHSGTNTGGQIGQTRWRHFLLVPVAPATNTVYNQPTNQQRLCLCIGVCSKIKDSDCHLSFYKWKTIRYYYWFDDTNGGTRLLWSLSGHTVLGNQPWCLSVLREHTAVNEKIDKDNDTLQNLQPRKKSTPN